MSKFKLKTSAEYKFGQTNHIPFAGKVNFDENGITEVDLADENELILLLNAVPDLSHVDGIVHTITSEDLKNNPGLSEHVKEGETVILPIEPQVDENELGKAEEDKNDIGLKEDDNAFTGEAGSVKELASTLINETQDEVNETAEEINAAIQSKTLDELNVQELREFAKVSEFPVAEWEALGKKDLRTYLKSKLQAAA